MKKYTTVIYENSHNSRRRRECGWFINAAGEREFRSSFTKQVFRDDVGGTPLPHKATTHRTSKYVPHVGKKQLLKRTKP